MSGKILVIGDMMLDIYCAGKVKRISPEAPIPILNRNKESKFVPGGACNVAMNVIASGHEACIAGVIGRDSYGDTLLSILNVGGADTSAVQRADIDTITKTRFISDNNQQLLRVDSEDVKDIAEKADHSRILDDIDRLIDQTDIIILSDYMKGTLSADFCQSVIMKAGEKGIRVLADIKDPDITKYKGAWLLKPNRSELNAITGMSVDTSEDIEKAAGFLMEKTGCDYVLTTCGSDGMVLTDLHNSHHIRSESRTVYDVTGAGDTVIAYLAAGLLDGLDIGSAAELSENAAEVAVSRFGTTAVSMNHKETLVFTNGCFDILHAGHIRYLQEARALGDRLIVGINSDASVRRLKGEGRPVNTAEDRALMLKALACVDEVYVFDEDTPLELIKKIRPDIIVKGGDYKPEEVVGRDFAEIYGGRVEIIPFTEGKSTTSIIDRIKNS